MPVSALAIGVQRILSEQAIVDLLGLDSGGEPSVFPIRLAESANLPAVTVNRLFQVSDEGNRAVLAITCMAEDVRTLEVLGEAVSALDSTRFNVGDLVDVHFDKSGPDVTGMDPTRECMIRQIEFLVSW